MTPNPAPNEPLYPDVEVRLPLPGTGQWKVELTLGTVFMALWANGYQEGARAFASAAAPHIAKRGQDSAQSVLGLVNSYVEVT